VGLEATQGDAEEVGHLFRQLAVLTAGKQHMIQQNVEHLDNTG
jgi:hypothetical protein